MAERYLLSVEETAARLSLSRAKVYEMIQAGILPSVRIGRAVRVNNEQLRQWVEENTYAS